MFKRFSLFLIVALLLTLPFIGLTEGGLEEVHILEDERCPDCDRLKRYLENDLKDEYPELEVIYYEVGNEEEEQEFEFVACCEKGIDYELRRRVPTVIIGENLFQPDFFEGLYYDKDGSEREREVIRRAIEGEHVQGEIDELRGIVSIPFTDWEIDTKEVSIPIMGAILGSLDGLNVCSIGALILILTIVLTFKSRKKILFYGGLFIFTAVTIYGLLVFAWTAAFEVLSRFIGPINTVIGIAAFLGGIYFLREFIRFYKHGPTCRSSSNKYVTKVTKKLKEDFNSSAAQTVTLITSVMLFAAVITLVELPCSFGLPMVYGGALAEAGLPWISYAFYIGLYLFFYMLIELIIFAGAVITKEVWIAESNLITWVYLAGTLVLFFLSYYYLIGL